MVLTECKHPKHAPAFDEAAAKALVASCKHPPSTNPLDAMFGICTQCTAEVRQRWPRFMGTCEDCHENLILYASMEHYTYGDW